MLKVSHTFDGGIRKVFLRQTNLNKSTLFCAIYFCKNQMEFGQCMNILFKNWVFLFMFLPKSQWLYYQSVMIITFTFSRLTLIIRERTIVPIVDHYALSIQCLTWKYKTNNNKILAHYFLFECIWIILFNVNAYAWFIMVNKVRKTMNNVSLAVMKRWVSRCG